MSAKTLYNYSIPNRHDLASGALLSEYDPYAHTLLVHAFGEATLHGESGAPRKSARLPDVTVRAQGGLVLAHSIAQTGRDTVFYHKGGVVDLAHAWASDDVGETVLGVEITSAGGERHDVDGNPVLLLHSLDVTGAELSAPNYVGIEIERAAVDGLRVYHTGHLPADMRPFNPYEFL